MDEKPKLDPSKFKVGEIKDRFIIIKVKNKHKWARLFGSYYSSKCKYIEFNDSFYFGTFKIDEKLLMGTC